MRARIWIVFALAAAVLAGPALADTGNRVRIRSVSEVTTVAPRGDLPRRLLAAPPRNPAPAASPIRSSTEVLPGVSVGLDVPTHDFGLGGGHPPRVSQREAFRVGGEANQATWALGFLPHQPDLRESLVALFRRLAVDTAEVEVGEGFRSLASRAAAGESPAVLLARHRDLMEALAAELDHLGGDRRWYFDLGYNAQHLRMVLFFNRRPMVGQGLAAMRILVGEASEADLEPDLRRRLERLTSLPAPRDPREDRAVEGGVEALISYF